MVQSIIETLMMPNNIERNTDRMIPSSTAEDPLSQLTRRVALPKLVEPLDCFRGQSLGGRQAQAGESRGIGVSNVDLDIISRGGARAARGRAVEGTRWR